MRGWARSCARNGWLRLGIAWLGATPIAVKQIGFRGLDGEAGVCKTGTVAPGAVLRCDAALEVSKQARLTGQ